MNGSTEFKRKGIDTIESLEIRIVILCLIVASL